MPETITTKDGKNHLLLGSTSLISIIRDYCGNETAKACCRRVSAGMDELEYLLDVNGISPAKAEEIRSAVQKSIDIY
nr:MAG TPA: hypothetical protein [Caudoviricetes sp.]